MRGKLAWMVEGLKMYRNIPAYAGKTYLSRFVQLIREEHPRVCGENSPAKEKK